MSAIEDKNIPITKEIIQHVSEKHNINKELLSKQYYFFVKEILNEVNNTDTVAIQIVNFGTFFIPIVNCLRRLHKAEQRIEEGRKGFDKEREIYEAKAEKITSLVDKAKLLGIKKKPYLKKFSHSYKILNE